MSSIARRPARLLTGLLGASAVVLLAAVPASAHVDPDPLAMQVGTTGPVAFGVEHGCDGSPTTKVEIQFPVGFTALKPVDVAGWTATVNGQVVTFSGGKLDAATKADFAVQVTVPSTPGTQYIPVVQTCEKGDIKWIEIPKEGTAEPEHPAAGLKLTAGVPTAEELKPVDDAPSADAATTSSSSSSNAGVVVGVVAVVVVVAGAAALVLRNRKRPVA